MEEEIKKCECKAGKAYIGVGCGALVFNNKKEVLLMKRGKNSKNEAGWWSQPGGTVDFGEKVVATVKREIKEELGIEVDVWAETLHVDHIIKKENQHWVALSFLAKVKDGIPEIKEPHKCDEIKWFSLDKLPKKITQTTRETINCYLEKKYIKL